MSNYREQLGNDLDNDLVERVKDAAREGAMRGARPGIVLSGWPTFILLLALIAAVSFLTYRAMQFKQDLKQEVAHLADVEQPAETHDQVIEDHGILGYTAADFQDAILGKTEQQKKLEVYTAEISDAASITSTGLVNLSIFTKYQLITYHGTAVYSVDLSKLEAEDITLDEESHIITLRIPHPEMAKITVPRDEIEFGDVSRGILAFGDIKMTPQEQSEVEAKAVANMEERLAETGQDIVADRFAKLSVWEIYQPIVKTVAKDYSLEVIFQD